MRNFDLFSSQLLTPTKPSSGEQSTERDPIKEFTDSLLADEDEHEISERKKRAQAKRRQEKLEAKRNRSPTISEKMQALKQRIEDSFLPKSRQKPKKKEEVPEKDPQSDQVQRFINDMQEAFDQDVESLGENKVAMKRILFTKKIDAFFKKAYLFDLFLELNGLPLLELFVRPIDDQEAPNSKIALSVLKAIQALNLDREHRKESKVERIVLKYMKLQNSGGESKQCKLLALKIRDSWRALDHEQKMINQAQLSDDDEEGNEMIPSREVRQKTPPKLDLIEKQKARRRQIMDDSDEGEISPPRKSMKMETKYKTLGEFLRKEPCQLMGKFEYKPKSTFEGMGAGRSGSYLPASVIPLLGGKKRRKR